MQIFKNMSFYSQKGIGIATFLGTPLAASVLIKHNYDQLGDKGKGRIAIILGLIVTIAMFVGIFCVSESNLNRIPRQIIPAVYTLMVYLIVERFQGNYLKQFEKEGGRYLSNWRAAAVGLFCFLLIIGAILLSAFLDRTSNAYDEGMQQFIDNEESAAIVYGQLSSRTSLELINEINFNSIPKWEQNIKLLDSLSTKLDLDPILINRNIMLRKYSELRIQELGFLKQSIILNTNRYDLVIDSLNSEMQEIIEELNSFKN